MLENARIVAIVPVSDLEAAVEFYESRLGLPLDVRRDDLPENKEAEFVGGDGRLLLYESVGAARAATRSPVPGSTTSTPSWPRSPSAASRSRRYDLPDLKTDSGIAELGDVRAAWCSGSGRQHPRLRVG